MRKKGANDYLIASVGGGSNAAGAFYHFLDNFSVKLLAVEAAGLGLKQIRLPPRLLMDTRGAS